MILTDRGKQFTSELFAKVNKPLGIKKETTVPYRPQTNGLIKRFNGTLKRMLSTYVNNKQNDWDECLPYVLFAYRTTRYRATGQTPYFLLYGHDPMSPKDSMLVSEDAQEWPQVIHELKTVRNLAAKSIEDSAVVSKKQFDRNQESHQICSW
jgi:transposase InsO family protein